MATCDKLDNSFWLQSDGYETCYIVQHLFSTFLAHNLKADLIRQVIDIHLRSESLRVPYLKK